jgi:ATP-dependent Clp protease ATP-binding subunit ClpB
VDETIIFHGLSKEDLAKIVDLQVVLLTRRLAERKFTISLTDAAKDFLIDVGYNPAFGARPLKRAIQRYIQDQLALQILEGKFSEGDSIVIDAATGNDQLLFSKR